MCLNFVVIQTEKCLPELAKHNKELFTWVFVLKVAIANFWRKEHKNLANAPNTTPQGIFFSNPSGKQLMPWNMRIDSPFNFYPCQCRSLKHFITSKSDMSVFTSEYKMVDMIKTQEPNDQQNFSCCMQHTVLCCNL